MHRFRYLAPLVVVFILLAVIPVPGQQRMTGSAGARTQTDPDPVASLKKLVGSKTNAAPDNFKSTAVNTRFITGTAGDNNFAASVASAGDVNGDGYGDIIVGAYGQVTETGTFAGRAYIYFGGPVLDATADVQLDGEAALDRFGCSVASAGDVNGDGYGDVIVGARSNDAGGATAGRAYIYFGGLTMDNVADITLTSTSANSGFGGSVASAGDVNGDGYGDVAVGASNDFTGGIFAGRAFIYFGGSAMDNAADVTLTGVANDRLGSSLASAGDVNGDGYGDLIVGAYGSDAQYSYAGRAYIYFGGASMNNVADVTMTPPNANTEDFFGLCVASAGDVNGDGYSDAIVGAYGRDTGGNLAGEAFIFFGGSSMDNGVDVTITGWTLLDHLGTSVSSAGDVNGDGYDDVIVGTPDNDAAGTSAGRTTIYFGGSAMDNAADITLTGAAAGDGFGTSVASAGDVNGDGYGDLLVAAPGNDGGGTNAGRVSVYLNAMTGSDIADEFMTGASAGDNLGISVASAGDVNGDGYDDVIIGAHLNDAGGTDAGRAYIYYGGPTMDNVADVTMTGQLTLDYFGWSVASAGDVNGDGYGDVIVGAYGNDWGNGEAGRAYIYLGGSSMDNVADVIFTGGMAGDYLGYSVGSAGDVNGDGLSDVIVGAPYDDAGGTDAGRAYIFYGGSTMNNVADVSLTGAAASDFFGWSVSSAGDVNGDGYSDVIVGAYGVDGPPSDIGRAYVYLGGPAMDNTVDVTISGSTTTGDYSGWSVASVGDVNGDHYGDVAVAAPMNDAGGTNAGRINIYYGGATMNSSADVQMNGAAASDFFGSSIASAGDVNGDGYGDVIIGAYGNDAGGTDAGRAYVYFGAISMDNSADITLTGAAASDNFGISVASSGNVNGDAFSDLIVGASLNDAGGSNAGRAYLFNSSSPSVVPRIASACDVPFDQGGSVELRWVRSGYDARGLTLVTAYSIERSRPAGNTGFFWEEIGRLNSRQNPKYSFTAAMPNDSMTDNRGAYFFRVTAVTATADQYWRSNIVSAYSVDNLSPAAPLGPSISSELTGELRVSWSPNRTDPDVGHYAVYRGTSNGFIPASGNRIATTIDSTFLDNTISIGPTYYYRVTTVDVHGNESTPSSQVSMAVLNVRLSSFTASTATRGGVTLQWTTVAETNNYGFEIARRSILNVDPSAPLGSGSPSANWEKVGFVAGSGTTSSSRFYNFTDNVRTSGRYAYRLMQVEQSGALSTIQEIEVEVNAVPAEFALGQNYPNPFNPSTVIRYDLPVDSRVRLTIYNIVGQPVGDLVEAQQSAGFKEVRWDAFGLPSGMYFYRLQVTGADGARFASIKKMMLVK